MKPSRSHYIKPVKLKHTNFEVTQNSVTFFMHVFPWFNAALQILRTYNHSMLFAGWLKNYFSQHKKHGSRDRKYISSFCYCFYRTGNLFNDLNDADKLTASVFVTAEYDEHLIKLFPDEWKTVFRLPAKEKLLFLQQLYSINAQNIFPLIKHLSGGIEINAFILSHFYQPDVFLRIRPGIQESVINQLNKENILYQQPFTNAVQLASGFNAQHFFSADKEVVVQDLSSQRVSELLNIIRKNNQRPLSIWDVCAGSGGKSILAFDVLGKAQLTATDIRPSIIHNLQQRFKNAGIKNYTAQVEDVSGPGFNCKKKFDVIICDVPCSGSGTWGRTPEQLSFFKEKDIHQYTALQKRIITNAVKCLLPSAYLLYITCSVFKEENEEMAEWILKQSSLILVEQRLLAGYNNKADTMFAALFSFP